MLTSWGEHPELARTLTERADAWFTSCVERARPPDGPAKLDKEAEAQLRAMGYLN